MSRLSSREEAVFTDALAQPEGDRMAFIEQACGGDESLRARVEALLLAHATPDNAIESGMPRFVSLPDEAPGDRIGRYKLLQKIGEGGCGSVWMAEQEEPVRRRVALKVIKLGMDTREVIARFSAERQALALMNHPNIAKVLDGGATESGRPYFVMELVRGIPITKFCDEKSLSAHARLNLFIQVCHAVQHAHQKGIIHRDIKPSNVLVTLHDDEPVPVVIDFGIAKATQGRLTDQTLFTAFDQFIGTPVYMSPEQADYNALDVDTRSDIYSLGVLLYELLTGRPPFDPKTLTNVAIDQIRRVIREIEPPRPSVRLRTLDHEERTSIARLRGTAPAQLSTLLRGDLDWIVMKAMEKNRTRRYESATALATDITRHLNNQTVSARPPGMAYSAWKLARRHQIGVAAVVAVTVAMVAGTAISLEQAIRARREQARADDLLIFMLREMETPLRHIGNLAVLDRVIEKAMQHFTARNPRELDDRTLLEHVKVLYQLGNLRVDQRRYVDAEAAYHEAHARALMLVARRPKNTAAWNARADAEWGNGFVRYKRGELAEAREWFRQERDSRTTLVALEPTNRQWQLDLAKQQGNFATTEMDHNPEGSRASYRTQHGILVKLLTENPDDREAQRSLANCTAFLGILAEATGDFAEAAERFAQVTAQYEALANADAKDPHWILKKSEGLLYHAGLCTITGHRADAARLLAEARALVVPLVEQDATNQRRRGALLTIELKQAYLAQAEGDYARGAELMRHVRGRLESTLAKEATDVFTHYRLANALRTEAELQHALGKPEASGTAARAVEVAEQLVGREGATPIHRAERAAAGIIAGRIAAAQSEPAAASGHWQRAGAALGSIDPKTRDWRILDPAARLARLLGQNERAAAFISQLEKLGYTPLEPWPEPSRPISPSKI